MVGARGQGSRGFKSLLCCESYSATLEEFLTAEVSLPYEEVNDTGGKEGFAIGDTASCFLALVGLLKETLSKKFAS
ncbi:UNVERIFIED_CONTAM: hypothetical protein K2H54_014357 [Gekko kuhli]